MLAFIHAVPRTHATHDDAIAFFGGALVAASEECRAALNDMSLPSTGATILLCEGFLAQLSDVEIDAVIAHELGHVVCGHLAYTDKERSEGAIRCEIEADAVAARIVGAAAVYSLLCHVAGHALDDPCIKARLDALFTQL